MNKRGLSRTGELPPGAGGILRWVGWAIAGLSLAFLWPDSVAWAQEAAAESGGIAGGLESALMWVEGLGPVAPIAFMLVYVVATVAFIPGSALTLGAGFLFGPILGSVVVFIGATLGATAAFLVGRYVARDWVKGKFIEGNDNFAAIDKAVGKEGFKIVLLTRLSPVFPFNVLNYLYGLTDVSLKDYVLASIGMLPGTVMYVYIGSTFGELAAVFAGREKSPAEWALYGVGLVATVIVTVYITKIAKKALNDAVGEPATEGAAE
ncbi:MAG: TVP38/TMEM64 family protein [Cyanobacteria bacterium P01_H01_bin.130]